MAAGGQCLVAAHIGGLNSSVDHPPHPARDNLPGRPSKMA
jgi:hypothetical protein